MKRKCSECGEPLSESNTGSLCSACEGKRIEKMTTDNKNLVDVRGYAAILGLDSEEQLRRLARKGVLAPRIPAIKRWQWRRKDIDDWFEQKKQAGDVFRKTAMGIASNLRRCSNDSMIHGCLDTIGDIVYGIEPILGTTVSGHFELIELVKVDRSIALKVLKQLPGEDFPELSGITDWADLAYDRISEDLIVRLEAYF